MKYFIDSEFVYTGKTLPVWISIALIREDEEDSLYMARADWDSMPAPQWVQDNVLSKMLKMPWPGWVVDNDMARHWLKDFLSRDDSPEFWGSSSAFDYIVLSTLMGSFEDWPKNWPYHINDVQQLVDEHRINKHLMPKQDEATLHHAYHDALHTLREYQYIQGILKGEIPDEFGS